MLKKLLIIVLSLPIVACGEASRSDGLSDFLDTSQTFELNDEVTLADMSTVGVTTQSGRASFFVTGKKGNSQHSELGYVDVLASQAFYSEDGRFFLIEIQLATPRLRYQGKTNYRPTSRDAHLIVAFPVRPLTGDLVSCKSAFPDVDGVYSCDHNKITTLTPNQISTIFDEAQTYLVADDGYLKATFFEDDSLNGSLRVVKGRIGYIIGLRDLLIERD